MLLSAMSSVNCAEADAEMQEYWNSDGFVSSKRYDLLSILRLKDTHMYDPIVKYWIPYLLVALKDGIRT